MQQALTEAGVDEDQVETSEYWIRQTRHDVYPEPEPGVETPTYRGTHGFLVSLDDVDAAGPVVDAAAGAGAEVRWVGFGASDSLHADLRDQALTHAVENAHRQATTLAEAGGLNVTDVRRMDASDRRPGPLAFEEDVADEAAPGDTVFVPGNVTVQVNVRVTYDAVVD